MTTNTQPDYDTARKSALEILESFGYEEPPVDPIAIANAFGIRVYFAEFTGESKKYSGFFIDKKNAIYINKEEFLPRQVFTIAHELGHWKLHKKELNSAGYTVLPREAIMQPSKEKEPIEQEADYFAANLLVPKFMLKQFYKIASIAELATLFRVSEPTVNHRMRFEYGV